MYFCFSSPHLLQVRLTGIYTKDKGEAKTQSQSPRCRLRVLAAFELGFRFRVRFGIGLVVLSLPLYLLLHTVHASESPERSCPGATASSAGWQSAFD